MKIKRVVVVYKRSSYEMYGKIRRDRRFLHLVKKGHKAASRFISNHSAHKDSMNYVKEVLKKRNIEARFVYRAYRFSEAGCDLIMSLGGDGTFLEASHSVLRTPMLGINSNPVDSVGMFCGCTQDSFEETLDQLQTGKVPIFEVSRLRVKLEDRILETAVLNDVLVAHRNPSATTRYLLKRGRSVEEQKSSGIWISPPAGTTAAIVGAGGSVLSLRTRGFQYRVREPFHAPGKKLKLISGVLGAREKLTVFSKMRAGRIYIDGSHEHYDFPLGDRLEITPNAPRLKIIGMDEKRRSTMKV